jgi:hypothetical protein
MNKLIIIVCFFVPFTVLSQKTLDFVGEKIDFTLNPDTFNINGIYTFINHSDKKVYSSISFPFAVETNSVIVKRIFNLTYLTDIEFKKNKNELTFHLFINAGDTVSINIAYCQPTQENNIYILTSTQAWSRPLLFAEYSLTVSKKIRIKSFSYTPDKKRGKIYYWKKTNFMPDKEFIISIH